jgi:hypothetical protein
MGAGERQAAESGTMRQASEEQWLYVERPAILQQERAATSCALWRR